jgi:hypothetical protein
MTQVIRVFARCPEFKPPYNQKNKEKKKKETRQATELGRDQVCRTSRP